MKKIIGILKPFDVQQQFFAYEDGNKIAEVTCTVDNIADTVINLAETKEIDSIDLTGPKQYAKGVCSQIKEKEISKYSEQKLTINII